jgi:hypothetical protein
VVYAGAFLDPRRLPMSAIRTPQPRSPLEAAWRDRVTRWKASGLNVREFCRGERLSEPSFYSWRRTLAERDADAAASDAPAFVPVHVRSGPTPPALEVVLRSGHVLRVPHGFDPDQLRRVVAILEADPC